jgi:cob(I)alamin adenosyltransferase
MTAEHNARATDNPGPGAGSATRSRESATTLSDGSRTNKADLRIVAYGEVEEASAVIGLAISLGIDLSESLIVLLSRVQNDLFDLGADLCTPVVGQASSTVLRVDDGYIARLERACDHFNADLPVLSSSAIPGGTATAALLHHARTVVRRAERATAQASQNFGDTMNPALGAYLNRLSSLLLILARGANAEHGDMLWQPGLSTTCHELWETGW